MLRSDIVLQHDVGRRSGPAFVVIREPGKARRRGVQAQQVTIDDSATVAFLALALGVEWARARRSVVAEHARGVRAALVVVRQQRVGGCESRRRAASRLPACERAAPRSRSRSRATCTPYSGSYATRTCQHCGTTSKSCRWRWREPRLSRRSSPSRGGPREPQADCARTRWLGAGRSHSCGRIGQRCGSAGERVLRHRGRRV